jgi:hypothetical protein
MSVIESLIPRANAALDTAAFGKVMDPIVTNILNPIMGALFTFGFFVFVWGVVEMIVKAESADARTQGQKHMLYGALGMFIMLSAWGIIRLIGSTINSI